MNPAENESPDGDDAAIEEEFESDQPRRYASPCVTCSTRDCEECDHHVGLEDVAAMSGSIAGKVSRKAFGLGKAWATGFVRGFRDE